MKYSVVIPLKNEEDNILPLMQELEPVMDALHEPWELLCIEDGSTDKTLQVLQEIKKQKPYLRVLVFDRNYGQSAAFDAGFRNAKGEWIITLDGDRQNDPRDIPSLLKHQDKADLICGQRVTRRDPWTKRLISKCANIVRRRLCNDGIHDTGCSLKAYRASCLQKIKLYVGMHRFLPALFRIEGFRIVEVPVNHRERTQGTTKYNLLNRSVKPIVDMWAVWWMRRRHLHYTIGKEI